MAKSPHSKRKKRRKSSPVRSNRRAQRGRGGAAAAVSLRIIGGSLGGRKLRFGGDPQTRPMRDAVRENLFNLVGPSIVGTFAIDFFAGTGAVVAEAISRGAERGIALEVSPTMVQEAAENLRHLAIEDRVRLIHGDTFAVARDEIRRDAGNEPWAVFCCPPYALFNERFDELADLIRWVEQEAPPESVMAVESRSDWDAAQLPGEWRVRCYGINQLAIWRRRDD